MNEIDEDFRSGEKVHEVRVKEWSEGRDTVISTLNWLGMTASYFESNWKNWLAVCGKRKALRACRKLKKQVVRTQNAVYDFMANAL